MVFSRTQRMDRRRRIVRESAANYATPTADTARSSRKIRRDLPSHHAAILSGIQTPNYSQDVRKTCQLRVVQWIPMRSGALAILIAAGWAIWCTLLLCHYFFHSNANSVGRSPVPFLQLLDLRSPHSIANWMTCQLWFLTAFASWLVYSIRKHRLDDFSATYRIWFVMIGLSVFSCFDTATSAMYLLGQSIDPWTKREIGYGGWPLILAAYASVAALVGLRLSTEIRISKAALGLWFGGLLAWGTAALLGTGLLKIQWAPGTIDLIVGGLWLGGVLAIFQSVGLVLRQCYLQAQRRFIERAVLTKSKFDWADPPIEQDGSVGSKHVPSNQDDTAEKKSWIPWRRNRSEDQEDAEDQDDQAAKKSIDPVEQTPKKPMRLFGLFPHRSERNEQLDGIEPDRIDEQVQTDEGLTKKPNWFARRKSADVPTPPKQSKSTPTASDETADPKSAEKSKRAWLGTLARKTNTTTDKTTDKTTNTPAPANQTQEAPEETAVKKSWFSLGRKQQPTNSDSQATPSKSTASTKASTPVPAKATVAPPAKPPTVAPAKAAEPERVESFEVLDELPPKSAKLTKRLFGWMDGLRFKPPKDSGATQDTKSTSGSTSSPAASKSSKSSASGTSAASPSSNDTNKSQPVPNEYEEEGSDEDYNDYRNLSKSERKKMRRQQNDRGAA